MQAFSNYQREKRKNRQRLFLLALFLILSFFLSFRIGRYPVGIREVGKVFLSRIVSVPVESEVVNVVLRIRAPRIFGAILIGGALSVSGTVYQALFRNPMVSPDILGVSGAAAFGAALSIFWGLSGLMTALWSFLFGLMGMGIAYTVALRFRGDKILGLILAGIMVGSIFSAMTSFLKLVADTENTLPAITYWLMGSLTALRSDDILLFLLPLVVGMIPLFLLRFRLNLFAMGEEEALTLGLDMKKLRFVAIFCATLMTATSVAIAGLIGWVGLVIPHMTRFLVGEDTRAGIPGSLLIGGTFLLWVDNVARSAYSMEIPIGILTSFLGVPFYLYLMGRRHD